MQRVCNKQEVKVINSLGLHVAGQWREVIRDMLLPSGKLSLFCQLLLAMLHAFLRCGKRNVGYT